MGADWGFEPRVFCLDCGANKQIARVSHYYSDRHGLQWGAMADVLPDRPFTRTFKVFARWQDAIRWAHNPTEAAESSIPLFDADRSGSQSAAV